MCQYYDLCKKNQIEKVAEVVSKMQATQPKVNAQQVEGTNDDDDDESSSGSEDENVTFFNTFINPLSARYEILNYMKTPLRFSVPENITCIF